MNYSESVIDERYRLMLLEHYLDGAVETALPNGARKWTFICPFCGPLATKDYKRRQKKGALLWNAIQHSWVFTCAKKGDINCMEGKTLGRFIEALNPALGRAYRQERWHSGTIGKGHNCQGITNTRNNSLQKH